MININWRSQCKNIQYIWATLLRCRQFFFYIFRGWTVIDCRHIGLIYYFPLQYWKKKKITYQYILIFCFSVHQAPITVINHNIKRSDFNTYVTYLQTFLPHNTLDTSQCDHSWKIHINFLLHYKLRKNTTTTQMVKKGCRHVEELLDKLGFQGHDTLWVGRTEGTCPA